MDLYRVGMQLRARELGRAVRASETKHFVAHRNAFGIAAFAMPGERTGIWGLACGLLRNGSPFSGPGCGAVADARIHAGQLGLWTRIAKELRAVRGEDEFQIVVSSRQAARLLAESAARFLYVTDDEVRHAAETVWWCLERREFAGSHACVVLTEALAEHFATGEEGGDPDDLRLFLPWLLASGHGELARLQEKYAAQSPDPKTDPLFDAEIWPKIKRNQDEREQRRDEGDLDDEARAKIKAEDERRLDQRDRLASTTLRKPLLESWQRLEQAWKILQRDPRPTLPWVESFCEADRTAWARQVKRRQDGFYVARKDSVRSSVHNWFEMGAAADAWEATLVWGDAAARQAAIANGHALLGEVLERNERGFLLRSTAETARVRVGDHLAVLADPEPIDVDVADVYGKGGHLYVALEWGDEPLLYALDSGSAFLLPARPDFSRRHTGWVGYALSIDHWLMDADRKPPRLPRRQRESDLLGAVEALRR